MKYYEFEYDNIWQKVLWGLEMICIGALFPFAAIVIILLIPETLPTEISFILIILSILAGIISGICNLKKLKGVFVLDDHIEIAGYYLINKKIEFDDIYDLHRCEYLSYSRYVRGTGIGDGGGRKNCLIIDDHIGPKHVKVKNQDKLIEDIISKCDKKFSIHDKNNNV